MPRPLHSTLPPPSEGIHAPSKDLVTVARMLSDMPANEALGMLFSYLLLAADQQPTLVRTLLNERVIKEGFTGISMLEYLKRIAK